MVFVTGDTHIPLDMKKLNTENFPEQKGLSKADCVIICGDFGGVWALPGTKYEKEDRHWQDWLTSRNYTTLFLDGNHENFPLLYTYPLVERFGGRVGQITESVFHLRRGEIYEIEGKRFFCFGGASSHDKWRRREGLDWWPEELPSREEMDYGLGNLERAGNRVDYILTHCCPSSLLPLVAPGGETDAATEYLQEIEERVAYTRWYFGHYHLDRRVDEKHTCLYQYVEKL